MTSRTAHEADESPINGPAVHYARKALKLTQYDLAELAKVSHPTIQRVERSAENVTRPVAVAVAGALGIPLDVVYDDPLVHAQPAPTSTHSPSDVARALLLAEDVPALRARVEALEQDVAEALDYIRQQQEQNA